MLIKTGLQTSPWDEDSKLHESNYPYHVTDKFTPVRQMDIGDITAEVTPFDYLNQILAITVLIRHRINI